jgi:hypothetical protein
MSNLGQQFSGGPNPGVVAIGAINSGLSFLEHKQRISLANQVYKEALAAHQAHYDSINNPTTEEEPPVTPSTPKPTPTSIHPITGETVPTVPVKRSKNNPTPPGTKPKRK